MRRSPFLIIPLAAASLAAATLAPTSSAQDQATPVLRVSDGDVVWNDVARGSSSTKTIAVRNGGGGSLTIGTPGVAGGDVKDFAIVGGDCAGAILTGVKTCSVSVRFAPTADATRVSHLAIPTNVSGCTAYVTLAGSGAGATGPDHGDDHGGLSKTCSGPTVVTVPGPSSSTTTTTTTPGPSTGVLGQSDSGGSNICQSKRRIRIHINAPRGRAIKTGSLTVQTKGREFTPKRVKTGKRKGQYYADLSFKGLKVGRYKVEIRGKLTNGKRYARNRYFVTCISGKTP